MMTDMFFEVIRQGLWGKQYPSIISSEKAMALMHEAEKQTVTGLTFDVLSEFGVRLNQSTVMKFFAMTQQIIRQNTLVNQQVKALAQLLDKNAVNYCIVKGQVAAQCYPKPELRQSGDVDFFCDADNYSKALDTLNEEWGVNTKASSSDHHVDFSHEGVFFELHFKLLNLYSKKRNSYLDKIICQAPFSVIKIEDTPIKTLTPTLHSLYIFLHLYHHLMELGVGLRQFCDWAAMLHYYHDDIRHDELKRHLHVLGMEHAYRACGSILIDWLGLPAEEFTYELGESDHRYAEKILGVIAYRGNMGKFNKCSGYYGWRHNLESAGIKISHYLKFRALAPTYSKDWLAYELKRKAAIKLK